MTGLDRQTDQIMSICCFVTDAQLNIYDHTPFEAIIHLEQETLDSMGDWCTDTHGKTGLTAACLKSTTTAQEAAAQLLKYIRLHVPQERTALLAGNSVHADKDFLSKEPYNVVLEHLHYRILDVSSIKEAVRRWAPEDILQQVLTKRNLHRAREDILESIQEARFYRSLFQALRL